jgi:hypothetical protein
MLSNEERSFSLKVDYKSNQDDFIKDLAAQFADLNIDWSTSSEIQGNQVEIEQNPDYGKNRPNEPEWWYYRYEIHFYAKDKVNMEQQRNLAQRMIQGLKALGAKVVIIGAFEDMENT